MAHRYLYDRETGSRSRRQQEAVYDAYIKHMDPDFSRLREIRRGIWEAEIDLDACLSALHVHRDLNRIYITQEKRVQAKRLRDVIDRFRVQEREILVRWGGYMNTDPEFF